MLHLHNFATVLLMAALVAFASSLASASARASVPVAAMPLGGERRTGDPAVQKAVEVLNKQMRSGSGAGAVPGVAGKSAHAPRQSDKILILGGAEAFPM